MAHNRKIRLSTCREARSVSSAKRKKLWMKKIQAASSNFYYCGCPVSVLSFVKGTNFTGLLVKNIINSIDHIIKLPNAYI